MTYPHCTNSTTSYVKKCRSVKLAASVVIERVKGPAVFPMVGLQGSGLYTRHTHLRGFQPAPIYTALHGLHDHASVHSCEYKARPLLRVSNVFRVSSFYLR